MHAYSHFKRRCFPHMKLQKKPGTSKPFSKLKLLMTSISVYIRLHWCMPSLVHSPQVLSK
ncbi:hypothetical protein AHAS_Ahas14G0130000 [Arachis hypogaea]